MAERPRVLVVEDDPSIREALEATLAGEEYEVRVASHGREALDLLRTWPADVILLDLMLPIMDGWVFLHERRRLDLAPAARVVVVSATRQARDAQAAELGVAAVVPKPFDLDALLEEVERQLDRSGGRDS